MGAGLGWGAVLTAGPVRARQPAHIAHDVSARAAHAARLAVQRVVRLHVLQHQERGGSRCQVIKAPFLLPHHRKDPLRGLCIGYLSENQQLMN